LVCFELVGDIEARAVVVLVAVVVVVDIVEAVEEVVGIEVFVGTTQDWIRIVGLDDGGDVVA